MLRRSFRFVCALALIGCSNREGTAAAQSITSQAAKAPATAADSTPAALAKADAGRIIGSASAPVWMIIISDFQCPYCKRWHDEVWEAVRREYVETGKIRVAYVNLPLEMHENAMPAALAAMCASAQGKFWPVQDALFQTQQEWAHLADPQPLFEGLVRQAGADVDAVRACVKSGAMRPLVQADAERAQRSGASSTPTFFVGDRPVIGAQPIDAFRDAINAALAAKSAGK